MNNIGLISENDKEELNIEDLEENYTAKINVNTGIPTPGEFTCYYRDKIKKLL